MPLERSAPKSMSAKEKSTDTIVNPILEGFNPDPSILRVGEDYYIATSTFEWFPGVQIYHSRDLRNWRLLTHALNRVSQLDMKGASNSGGVWAPCLSYHDGLFHLAYTNASTFDQTLFCFDTPNYLVTAKDIKGEWSEPTFLNSSGFDPSLFHDDDGRKWLVNMLWDHRKDKNRFGGILLQEYSPKQKKLIGPTYNIFKGTKLGITEGPHLYKRNGYYYLMTAEGGTSYGHAVTVARSKHITGPYVADPKTPLISARDNPKLEIQKAGHASLVQAGKDEWYIAYLCGRPLTERGRCPLGRETCLEKVVWTKDGWLRPADGVHEPKKEIPAPKLKSHPWPVTSGRDDFDSPELSVHFQTLRIPLSSQALSLTDRPGYLRLKGKGFLNSYHEQALVARRRQAYKFKALTHMEFIPENYQHMAGLVVFYDTNNFFYLRMSVSDAGEQYLGIITSDKGKVNYALETKQKIVGWNQCHMQVEGNGADLQFFYSKDGSDWKKIGPVFDSSRLSDECVNNYAFTGTFIGLCCQDLAQRSRYADFDFFEYGE